MALRTVNGRKTVTTPGTAVQLSISLKAAVEVLVSALSTNTGIVCVGGSSVLATAGSESGVLLKPGETARIYGGMSCEGGLLDLTSLYLDAAVAGEGICYLALRQ